MIEEDKNTDGQLQKVKKQPTLKASEDGLSKSKRRRLLKSAVAIPVIMTLHSGAALARTSNLVGPHPDLDTAAKTANGDLICVVPGSDSAVLENGTVDIGSDATAIVHNPPSSLNGQAAQCNNAGGILVSANAWNSIAVNGNVTITF